MPRVHLPAVTPKPKASIPADTVNTRRAVQLLLGHTKVDSTVRYLGVELEGALSIAERIKLYAITATGAIWSPT